MRQAVLWRDSLEKKSLVPLYLLWRCSNRYRANQARYKLDLKIKVWVLPVWKSVVLSSLAREASANSSMRLAKQIRCWQVGPHASCSWALRVPPYRPASASALGINIPKSELLFNAELIMYSTEKYIQHFVIIYTGKRVWKIIYNWITWLYTSNYHILQIIYTPIEKFFKNWLEQQTQSIWQKISIDCASVSQICHHHPGP